MGDWCGGSFADTHKRNTERGKVLKTTDLSKFYHQPLQGKIVFFFLNGGVYSLTRGLLMGDPFVA